MTYGIGILGAGMIATTAVGVLPGMRELAGRARVRAIASRTRATAEAAAAEFGIDQVHDDLSALLADPAVDVVVNLTPISAHFETSRQILAAGKHLVTEKPLAATVAECDELIAVARAKDRQIVVASPRMLEPSRRRAASMVQSGAIGPVTLVRARVSHAGPGGMPWPSDPRPAYAPGAGPLRDLGPYAIEQLSGIVGPIERVSTLSRRSRASFPAWGEGPFSGVEVPVHSDDTVALACELQGGAFALIDCSFGSVAASSPQLEIFGLEGTLELYTWYGGEQGPRLRSFLRERGTWVGEDTPGDQQRQQQLARLGRAVLVEHMLDILDDGSTPVIGASMGRHVVAVIEAAEASAHSGRLEPVRP
ncbi:Gfo/Idh/MocA family protein [Kineosporia babensis]|uniref:Gfo/Idh/MocA family oxidoreductase n=1 Tax=Kineosporia babensis TaxID=499548 RepID=A0A9X1NHY1_9ACTN|nr:Gfo/Idh/MocA family oxidoreductase [Kineosporia babensis]MCD5314101.1 Gfo/Idh/MocA family oxidoreductase [Kineosporia babensis]